MTINLTTPTLYSIADGIRDILTADEWTDEQSEELDRLTLCLEAKAHSIASLIQHAEARADEIGTEIERLATWKRGIERKTDWLKGYLLNAMKAAERSEIETTSFRLRLQKNPPAAVATDESQTPARYVVTIPESHRPDKKAILAALKDGEIVSGWRLSQGERLVIR